MAWSPAAVYTALSGASRKRSPGMGALAAGTAEKTPPAKNTHNMYT